MKAIICGGRDYIAQVDSYDKLETICLDNGITEIVSGGARGADWLGEVFAKQYGFNLTIFPADWKKYGRSAGPIRNAEMGDYADMCIAFPGGRGTENMITYMLNIEKIVIRI